MMVSFTLFRWSTIEGVAAVKMSVLIAGTTAGMMIAAAGMMIAAAGMMMMITADMIGGMTSVVGMMDAAGSLDIAGIVIAAPGMMTRKMTTNRRTPLMLTHCWMG